VPIQTIHIPEELNAELESLLARQGRSLDEYVTETLRRQLFWDTVDEVQAQNRDLTPEQADMLAAEAVEWARATGP